MNNFKKIISLVLAVVLVAMTFPVVAFAAEKGDVNGDGEVAAKDARLVLQVVAGIVKEADLKDAAAADVDGKNGITAADARRILQMVAGIGTPEQPKPEEPKPDVPAVDSQKAELAALFNAETAKAAKGSYRWSRECKYSKNLSANGISPSTIQSVVDDFLGIGETNGTQANAGKYALVAMNLTESDIKDYKATSSYITLNLNDSSNPEVGADSPFSHVSKDIVTKKDVENKISSSGVPGVKLNSFYAYYYNITLNATLDQNGKPKSLSIRYTLYAKLGAKALGKEVTGDGTVETEIFYTDFNY